MRNVRSTLLISSFGAIRDAGKEKAYLAALPVQYHGVILDAVAGIWLPVEVAFAHYNACGMLGFSHEQQVGMGRQVGERMRGTLLGTIVRMAKEMGASPLTVIPQFQRFWNRAFDGGGLSATKVGPKEVHITAEQVLLADSSYWRSALAGLAMSVLDMFCQKSYMQERVVKKRVSGSVYYRVQWA
jgi:hypothetical protein